MSREALDGLRAEVDALRQGPAPLRPAAGLADLPALVERIRSAACQWLPSSQWTARRGSAPMWTSPRTASSRSR